jgi:hypothetical protein
MVPVERHRLHRGVFVGSTLALVGLIAATVWFVVRVPAIADDLRSLEESTAAQPLEFEVTESVDWTLFIQPSSESLSGVRFAIVDVGSGDEIPLTGSPGSFTYNWFGRSGRAIARADIPPGRYRLVVGGGATIAIGPNPSGRILWAVGGAALIGIPLILGGIAVAVVSFVRDTRRRTVDAEPPPPSPWSAGEWPADRGG